MDSPSAWESVVAVAALSGLLAWRRKLRRSLAALNQEEGLVACPFRTSFQIHVEALLGFCTLISEFNITFQGCNGATKGSSP